MKLPWQKKTESVNQLIELDFCEYCGMAYQKGHPEYHICLQRIEYKLDQLLERSKS